MLSRIRIRNYKSLVDVEISLDSLVVLFGPNGAGKSNFLDALQLLSRLAVSRTLKDAFELLIVAHPSSRLLSDPKGFPACSSRRMYPSRSRLMSSFPNQSWRR